MTETPSRWRTNGVRIVRNDELDDRTAQTLGMQRRAAVTTERTGATKLWAGTVTIDPKAKTGAHHHGDFIYVPPYVPHQEINASDDLKLHCVLTRSGQQGLVVNLDIEPVEVPELVRWIDDLHR
jgi:uncharacterized RmlC-like cupin family protein